MLQEGKISPQMQQWLERLAWVVEQAQAALVGCDIHELARRSGCSLDAEDNIRITFLDADYLVAAADFSVRQAESEEPPSSYFASLILSYLAAADGRPWQGGWIGFRDLPDAMFYAQAFQGYSGGRLVRELDGGVDSLHRAAARLDGQPLDIGSAAYAFDVLPRVQVAVAYYEGDEDFAAQAQVLFSDNAAHYMSTDGLAILGSQVVDRLLQAALAS